MGESHETRNIGVYDVRQALDALYDDFGFSARVVVFVRREAAAPATLSVVAQLVDGEGRPTMGEEDVRQVWPNNQFRTFTAACHWCLWQLYQRTDIRLERVRAEAAARKP